MVKEHNERALGDDEPLKPLAEDYMNQVELDKLHHKLLGESDIIEREVRKQMVYIKQKPESRRRLKCPLLGPNSDLGGRTLKEAQELADHTNIEKGITHVATMRYNEISSTKLPTANTTNLPNPGVTGDKNL